VHEQRHRCNGQYQTEKEDRNRLANTHALRRLPWYCSDARSISHAHAPSSPRRGPECCSMVPAGRPAPDHGIMGSRRKRSAIQVLSNAVV
jgi:hypothetical protein